MKEKTLKARAGMPVLFLSILLYIGAVLLVVWGAVLLEAGRGIGALPLVVGIIWLIIGFIPFMGLKVIKPQEALVLTLFVIPAFYAMWSRDRKHHPEFDHIEEFEKEVAMKIGH